MGRRSGTKRPAWARPIWAVDSEAQGDRLVAVVAVSETGERRELVDPMGLDTHRILSFLLGLPRGISVAYSFGYDVSMWLRDVPFLLLDVLRRVGWIRWGEWRIGHVPGKRFEAGKHGRKVVIWDVFGWYQASFGRLVTEWELGTDKEREEIVEMKRLRAEFGQVSLERIVEYCALECRLLAQWVRRMIELHRELGLILTTYCGAGSTAASMLERYRYQRPQVRDEVESIAHQAYYGGRVEIYGPGYYVGPVHVYDINSAYPYWASRLPKLMNRWRWVRDPGREWWGYGYVEWDCSTVWGPFPVRGKASLVYPTAGAGWYHSWEIQAAQRAGYRLKLVRALVHELDGELMFPWIPLLAELRLRYKQERDPRHQVLKLGLNALYGKLAQSTGKAPYRSLVLAGAITAGTRGQILEQLSSGARIVLVATDSVVSLDPLAVEVSSKLGAWSYQCLPDLFVAQCGVYWSSSGKVRSRGVESQFVDRELAERVWREQGIGGRVPFRVRRFSGYRTATSRGSAQILARWIEQDRVLSFDPTPRRIPLAERGQYVPTRAPNLEEYERLTISDDAWVWEEVFEEEPEWLLDEPIGPE